MDLGRQPVSSAVAEVALSDAFHHIFTSKFWVCVSLFVSLVFVLAFCAQLMSMFVRGASAFASVRTSLYVAFGIHVFGLSLRRLFPHFLFLRAVFRAFCPSLRNTVSSVQATQNWVLRVVERIGVSPILARSFPNIMHWCQLLV